MPGLVIHLGDLRSKLRGVSSRGRVWGSGGCTPSGVQGQSPWLEGQGQSPLKLKYFWLLDIQ